MRVGIIGPGAIARKMAGTINALDGIYCYAVASRDINRAKEFASEFGFEKVYSSYEDLVSDELVDLVYIATTHNVHYEQLLLCLKYHKPVLCEKILTTSLKDTKYIYQKFKKENLFILEALWTSFTPSREIIERLLFVEKRIGEIIKMDASFEYSLIHKERVINKDLGGGVYMDIGLYPVSFIFRTLGFTYQSVEINDLVIKNDVDLKEKIEFTYPNNVMAVAYVDGTKTESMDVNIYGSKGRIKAYPVNCPDFIEIYDDNDLMVEKIDCRPLFGGFEYEILACKKALEDGKIECFEWSHANSISLAKIADLIK